MREYVGDASAGDDWAWIRLAVSDGRIVDAAGEGPGVARLARAVRDLTALEAAAVPGEDDLATEALAAALAPAVEAPCNARRAAVAMSGGVDSAVALLHAREEGHEPVGVTLRLWTDPAGRDASRACCSPDAVRAARRLCHDLGVPHVTLDGRERFREIVVASFVRGYAAGETPNPCARCNGGFRFDALLRFAARIGAARLATGHYAQVVRHRGRLLIGRGADPVKDQSYMLGLVDPGVLPRLWFPLGGQSKDETRAQGRAAGLQAAARPESQEACFLAGDDYRTFLERHGLVSAGGPVIDGAGRKIGRHEGYWRFTPGQRRGLGVAGEGEPLYAVTTIPERNTVVAGPRRALARTEVHVHEGRLHVPVDRVEVKLRYRTAAVPALVEPIGSGFELKLERPVEAVASGQVAVLYEEGAIVGAGLISGAA
jgi:tRNA-specific 2-thiouridylase